VNAKRAKVLGGNVKRQEFYKNDKKDAILSYKIDIGLFCR
jgi:hypothetical protein